MTKNIVVTGVVGFIGINLTKRLLKDGYSIMSIDKNTSRLNLTKNGGILHHRNLSVLWMDINHLPHFTRKIGSIQKIFHLAASADIMKSAKSPYLDIYNNVQGTHAILEFMRKCDINDLIFSSSSAVYGEGSTPMQEDMKDMRPISLYGASKLAAEAFINAYVDLYGIKASIFRFANVVGRYEHRGVIPDFVRKLKANPKQLEILGDGNQIKSYFMVDDCIEALIKLKPTKPASIYNLGALDTMRVTEIADIIVDEMGLEDVKYSYTGGDRGWQGDVPITILSIEKAMNADWKPRYNCEESVRNTVRYLLNG